MVIRVPALCLALAAALVFCGQAASAEPPYMDDRSDAASLIKSFYNAVSRREYARAWDYFGETKPSPDFETFVKGFANTDKVFVATGEASEEGAAGSAIFSLPTAIVAFAKDQSEQVFAGCYTVRLANPSIQEPPFAGLHIEKAELKPAQAPFEEQVPKSCGDAPAPEAANLLLAKATRLFSQDYAGLCTTIRPDGVIADGAVETHAITFQMTDGSADDPDRTGTLFRFYCGSGAYNESHVYYLNTELEGLRLLRFATPELDIRYENDDHEGKVESTTVIGYTAADELVNSFYDEATKSITSASKWRGVGDASSSGTWLFRNGTFTLVRYEVDASYDGEINPETILDYNTGP